jgi:hypothetical protein
MLRCDTRRQEAAADLLYGYVPFQGAQGALLFFKIYRRGSNKMSDKKGC